MNAYFKELFSGKRDERIYLDYASGTPVRKEALDVMEPFWSINFGNPSAVHEEGRKAKSAIESARNEIGTLLHIRANEVTFVSGGTEANNLALFGVVDAALRSGRNYGDIEIITTPIEHPSIIEALKVLEKRGVVVQRVPVSKEGLIDRKKFESLLNERTLLVTFAYANSEIGVVEDVKSITHSVRKFKKDVGLNTPYVHIDASQAPLWLPLQMDSLGVDLMTLDSGKFCGPKGVGVLLHRSLVPILSQVHGGDQESFLRAGTESTPLIVGFKEALLFAQLGHEMRAKKVSVLRDYFISELKKKIKGCSLNGSEENRIANNVNIIIPGIDGEYAVVWLDENGISASTRSACSSIVGGGSYVVRELGETKERSKCTLRFTLGEETTKEELVKTVEVLKELVLLMKGE